MTEFNHTATAQSPSSARSCSREFDLGLSLPEQFKPGSIFPGDRLLRLHPHWFVRRFSRTDESFTAEIEDYSSGDQFDLAGQILYDKAASDLITIHLDKGIEMTLTFLKENDRLKVRIDTPGAPVDDDHPILLWVRAIREYLFLYTRTTPWSVVFRLIMNRMILQMNPSQRKISIMITKITVIEVLVIILIVVGYVIFGS